jgi:hypothetical protein
MFRAWMKTSSVGRTTSRPFCGWDVEAIVEVRGEYEESRAGCQEDPERWQFASIIASHSRERLKYNFYCSEIGIKCLAYILQQKQFSLSYRSGPLLDPTPWGLALPSLPLPVPYTS